MLIESVHRFSVYPIVVLHGGMATPVHWNPEIYPRLVLLSMAELPPVAGFGATQLAAAVISHVQTGILLSYGALVFPGIDRFFAAAEREIHALYPYPILTASYFEREVHTEAYWTHVCAEGLGCNQSMHWSQLEGISWSFYALDFSSFDFAKHAEGRGLFRGGTLCAAKGQADSGCGDTDEPGAVESWSKQAVLWLPG